MAEPAPVPRPDEPTGMTLADLVALVAGAAIALGIDWFASMPVLRILGGRPAPGWYSGLFYLQEGLQKGGLALFPVVIARRLRYGGPLRVAEFAALAMGLPRMLLWFERLPFLGLSTRDPVMGYDLIVPERYQLWHAGLLGVAVLAAVVLAAWRRRLAPWVAGLLLLVAWAGLTHSGQVLSQEVVKFSLQGADLPFTTMMQLDALKRLPFGTLTYLPIVAAALDAVRPAPGAPPRTWVERLGLGLALGWFLTHQVRLRIQWFYETPQDFYPMFEVINLASLLIEVSLSLWLLRRFGPAWSRCFGVGYHGKGD